MRGAMITGGVLVVLAAAVGLHLSRSQTTPAPSQAYAAAPPARPIAEGRAIARLDGVAVYDNGPLFTASHGRNRAVDGYYFGQKWQCVEFVKRYLYEARGHRMPEVMGHAISFFDLRTPHGAINAQRGMVQYRQGGDEPPTPGDLIVFSGVKGYGHVAIVAARGDGFIEVVQQNKAPARERLTLRRTGKGYAVQSRLPALGWLRASRS